MDKIRDFLTRIEKSQIGFGLWISTALCIIFIRDFLETAMLYPSLGEIDLFHYIHVPVFYLSLLLALTILLHLFSKVEIIKVSKVSLGFLGIIILPVLIDFFVYADLLKDMDYSYIVTNLPGNFVNFFNPFFNIPGVHCGMRIEVACICILCGFYIYIKRNNLLLSFVGAALAFTLCFFHGSLPGLLVAFSQFLTSLFPLPKVEYLELLTMFTIGDRAVEFVTTAQLVIMVLLIAFWFWRYDKHKFKALSGNLRLSRSLHYLLLVVLGVVFNLSFYPPLAVLLKIHSLIILMGAFFSMFFAFQFAVIINDIFDLECDKISNKNRPLAKEVFYAGEYLNIGMVYLALALFFALGVSNTVFKIVLIFISLAFIYSSPPFRLRRFFPTASVIIGIEGVLAFLLGYLLIEQAGVSLRNLPAGMSWLLFLIFLLAGCVKDLKDIEGDRACGVYTLPVIFGEARGRKITGLLVCISYLMASVFLARFLILGHSAFLFILAFIFGAFNYFYIIKKDAKENIIFLVYFIYLFFILLFLGLKSI